MRSAATDSAAREIRAAAHLLDGDSRQFDPLLDRIGSARFVLLGEATHGTEEFYRARAEITKRLFLEKGFTVVAWEADWPDALRLHRHVRGHGPDAGAEAALSGFRRFPVWMWRNTAIVELAGWLRRHNRNLPAGRPRAGIYGLDLYSLHASMRAVVDFLQKIDPSAAAEARQRYSCFEDFGDDPQAYGMTASVDRSLSCEQQVVEQLLELQRNSAHLLQKDGPLAAEELFFAEQNALLAKNAEEYYRAMYRGRPNTWNLRDTHMADTLDRLLAHLQSQGEAPKAVIWAHNSHLGDARHTEMSRRDELNVGQLLRERHRHETVLVGFTTYDGTVTAASEWDGATERKRVRPAMRESYEHLLHASGAGDFLIRFDEHPELNGLLNSGRLERAIGVIYRPETERYSHYFFADLGRQFDAVVHYDRSHALHPLDKTSQWEQGELPDTFPSGL